MAKYNTKKLYNQSMLDGGAAYNSGPYVVFVYDEAEASDIVPPVTALVANIVEQASGIDSVSNSAHVHVDDIGNFIDIIQSITPYITVADEATGVDGIQIIGQVNVSEQSYGYDSVLAPAATFFHVDEDGYLQPLGVFVDRDSRYELIAPTRDITAEIPGAHGELDLGTMLGVRTLELSVVADKDPDCEVPFDKEKLRRLYAQYLDPTKGYKNLAFSDDIDKTYEVKYSGKIDIEEYATWFRFTIPFKMLTPFIVGSFEHSLTGSGTIDNEGTFETGLLVEIAGPITDPSVTIGASVLKYTGTINAGQILFIDTEKKTAKIGNTNAMADYNKSFPLLPPGEQNVIAPSNVTIKWKHKWL